MSMPLGHQPPPMMATQHSYNTHSSHESVGPVIAVLVVIIILGVLAGMIGRLCSGTRIMGYGEYDIERWAESKCSSCIDGSISPPLQRRNVTEISVPTAEPIQTHQQTMQEELRNPPANAES